MKFICYVVDESGVDGKEKPRPVFASRNELERDIWFEFSPNKAIQSCRELIVEEETALASALGKIDAIDKLMLNVPQKKYPPKVTQR